MDTAIRTRLHVREIMNSPVQSVEVSRGVDEIAGIMSKLKIGSVVVTSKEKPIGIITDGDIVSRVAATDSRASELKAGDIMSEGLYTIPSDQDITRAARTMIRKGVKRLGVEYRGELVGIVSMSDVMRVTPEMMDIISEKSRILTGERPRTSGYVAGFCDTCSEWSDYLRETDGKFQCDDCGLETPKLESED